MAAADKSRGPQVMVTLTQSQLNLGPLEVRKVATTQDRRPDFNIEMELRELERMCGQWLEAAREEAHLTRAALCHSLHISESVYSKWVAGVKPINFVRLLCAPPVFRMSLAKYMARDCGAFRMMATQLVSVAGDLAMMAGDGCIRRTA